MLYHSRCHSMSGIEPCIIPHKARTQTLGISNEQ